MAQEDVATPAASTVPEQYERLAARVVRAPDLSPDELTSFANLVAEHAEELVGRGDESSIVGVYSVTRRAAQRLEPGPYRDWLSSTTSTALSGVAANVGRVDLACDLLDEVRRDSGAGPHRSVVAARLADLHRGAGDWARATELLADAERPDLPPWARAQVLAVRANTDLLLGLIDRAWATADELSHVASTADDASARSLAVWTEASIAIATDDYDWGRSLLEEAALEGSHGDAWQRRYDLLRGVVLAELSRRDPALRRDADRLLREVLELDAGTVGPHDRFTALRFRADLALAGDDPAPAASLLGAARELVEASRLGDRSPIPTTQRAMLSALEAALVRRLGDEGERARAALDRLRADYRRFLDEWRAIPFRPGGIGFLHFNERRRIASELIELTLRVEPRGAAERAALSAVLEAQSLGSLARISHAPPGDVDRVTEELLGDDAVALIYVPGPRITHLFSIHRGDVQIFRLAGRDALDGDIVAYLTEVTQFPGATAETVRASAERATAMGAALRDALLPAELRRMLVDVGHITIVGDALLGHLPFESLPLDDGTVGTRWAIDALPSIPVGLHLASRDSHHAAEHALDLCLIAAPTPNDDVLARWPGLAPLQLDADTRRRLVSPFAPDRVRVWRGPDATRARLASAEVAGCRMLHVLAHGCQLLERLVPAALILSPESPHDSGLVPCANVGALRAPPIVVLSACEAARGQERRGEDGLTHLGGAFLRAGARCVVLSHYRIEYDATTRLISAFQHRIADGDPPAEAMRAARATLHRDPRYRHPFFHSLIQVQGLGRW